MNNINQLLNEKLSIQSELDKEIKIIKEKYNEKLSKLDISLFEEINNFIISFNSYLREELNKKDIFKNIWELTYDEIYGYLSKEPEDLFQDNEQDIFQDSDDERAYFRFGELNKILLLDKEYIVFNTYFSPYERFEHKIPISWLKDSSLWKVFINNFIEDINIHFKKKKELEKNREKALYLKLKNKYENTGEL